MTLADIKKMILDWIIKKIIIFL